MVDIPHNTVKIPRKIFLALAWSDTAPISGEIIKVANKLIERVYPTVASVPFSLVMIHKGKKRPVTPALNNVLPMSYIIHEIIDRFIMTIIRE